MFVCEKFKKMKKSKKIDFTVAAILDFHVKMRKFGRTFPQKLIVLFGIFFGFQKWMKMPNQ